MLRKTKNRAFYEKVEENLSRNFTASESDSESDKAPKLIHFDKDDYNFSKDEVNKSFSHIRKRNVQLLSEQSNKYSGEIVPRKSVDNNSEDGSAVDDFEVTSSSEEEQGSKMSERLERSYSYKDSDENDSVQEDEEAPEGKLVSAEKKKIETKKGMCVQNQLAVWEKLLEIRIHSQKMLNKANSLPFPQDFSIIFSEKEHRESAEEARKNAEVLLEKLIEAQVNLASQFSEIKKIGLCQGKRSYPKSNENTSPSKRFALTIESNFEKFRTYRNSVLLKWDDRTKLLTPGTNKGKNMNEEFDIVRKIDNHLINKDEHIAKSRKLKGTYKLFGYKNRELVDQIEAKEDIFSKHIYDDTDFYHSQLRELIEFKSDVSSNAYDVTRQFAELQKLRQKMKKKVDTRASKGRKIRYVVHHKLINFMAPNNTTEWTEGSQNELYGSLFIT